MHAEPTLDPSDSRVQHEIEKAMLGRLGNIHPEWAGTNWKTTAAELGLQPIWQNARPDAVWKTNSGEVIVAECYARIGVLKPGHRRKLALDALKLLALRRAVAGMGYFRFLLVVPSELDAQLHGDSWLLEAIRQAADIVPIALSTEETIKLSAASGKQAKAQSRLP